MKHIQLLLSLLVLLNFFGCGPTDPPQPKSLKAEGFFLKPEFKPYSRFDSSSDTTGVEVTIKAFPEVTSLAKNGFTFADFRNDKDILSFLRVVKEANTDIETFFSSHDNFVNFSEKFLNFEKLVEKWSRTNLPSGMDFESIKCNVPLYRNTGKTGLSKGALNFPHADFDKTQPMSRLFDAIEFGRFTHDREYAEFITDDFWTKHEIVTMLNIWMPIEPIKSFPLAVVDKSTLSPGDLVPATLIIDEIGKPFTGLILKHREGQEYFYRPNQNVGEALIFETFHTPHFAFKLPGQTEVRESTEVRCVFYKKKNP